MLPARARRLVSLLAALTALVLAGCVGLVITPAVHGLGVQDRVGAFNVQAPTLARLPAAGSTCSRPGSVVSGPGITAGFCVAAEGGANVAGDAAGVVYRRTDLAGGKPYIGQAISGSRFAARQLEHGRANPFADFQFEQIGSAQPGTPLDRLEEYFIRQEGGPTNLSNPEGGLANARHQMSDPRYQAAGGDPFGP